VPKKSLAIPTFAPCAIELVTCAEAKYILGGISTATLYRGIASGRYPAPLKVGPNTSRWNRAKLEECVQQLETKVQS
jgi:predicted DNA-binding transcriptional regulator AlpA